MVGKIRRAWLPVPLDKSVCEHAQKGRNPRRLDAVSQIRSLSAFVQSAPSGSGRASHDVAVGGAVMQDEIAPVVAVACNYRLGLYEEQKDLACRPLRRLQSVEGVSPRRNLRILM